MALLSHLLTHHFAFCPGDLPEWRYLLAILTSFALRGKTCPNCRHLYTRFALEERFKTLKLAFGPWNYNMV